MGRVTLPQLALAAALGVAGGLYVYKPIYQQYSREQSKAREPGPGPGPEPAQHKQAEGGKSRRGNDAPES